MPSIWNCCHMQNGDHAEVCIETRSVNLKNKYGGIYPYVSLFLGDLTRAKLTAAAINGDLRDLLDDLYELVDDLGDGAPDSPPHAHRALNLAARLDELLGRPPAPRPTPEPCTEEAREQDCCCTLEFVGPYPTDIPEPKRHPECPVHGWRDPDAELDAKRDDEMMERIGAGGST